MPRATGCGRPRRRNRTFQDAQHRFPLQLPAPRTPPGRHTAPHRRMSGPARRRPWPRCLHVALTRGQSVRPRWDGSPAPARERSGPPAARPAEASDAIDRTAGWPMKRCRARGRRNPDEPARSPGRDLSSTRREARLRAGWSRHQGRPAAQPRRSGRRHDSACR